MKISFSDPLRNADRVTPVRLLNNKVSQRISTHAQCVQRLQVRITLARTWPDCYALLCTLFISCGSFWLFFRSLVGNLVHPFIAL